MRAAIFSTRTSLPKLFRCTPSFLFNTETMKLWKENTESLMTAKAHGGVVIEVIKLSRFSLWFGGIYLFSFFLYFLFFIFIIIFVFYVFSRRKENILSSLAAMAHGGVALAVIELSRFLFWNGITNLSRNFFFSLFLCSPPPLFL